MPHDDGLRDEMPIRPTHPGAEPDAPALDERAAERLLAGRAGLAEVPPDSARLAELLAAAAAPPSSDELAGEDAAVAAFVSAARPVPPRAGRRHHFPRRRLVGVKLAAAVAVLLLSLAGVAAAATGSLPDPAQRVAHRVLGGAGVPGPDEHRNPPDRATSTSQRPGPTGSTAAGPSSSSGSGEQPRGGQGIPPTTGSEDRRDEDHGRRTTSTTRPDKGQGQGEQPGGQGGQGNGGSGGNGGGHAKSPKPTAKPQGKKD
jgi:hypothetical protein